jgi:hypothetical protein
MQEFGSGQNHLLPTTKNISYRQSAKAPAGDLFRTGFLMVRFRKNDEFLRAIRIFNDGVCCGKFIANGRHECGNSC